MKAVNPFKENQGLRVVAYAGDNKILLAMSLTDAAINETDKNLAGFAIWRTSGGKEVSLGNRISFTPPPVPGVAAANAPKWTDSDKAPLQKFRWVDVPPEGFGAKLSYRVRAMFFAGTDGPALKDGPEVTLEVQPAQLLHSKFRPGFTRGYIASQAYADKFKNADIRPKGPKSATFDVTPFEPQYKWLGADARTELFDLIADIEEDTECRMDVFAYDLDMPDVIAAICRIGQARPGKVRAILDDAALHVTDQKTGKSPTEVDVAKMIIAALGEDNVKQGHFARYQHNKVFIKRDKEGRGQKVLFGSMNFSIRGVYVQANNVIVVDDPNTAQMFSDAFDAAFRDDVKAAPFAKEKIAQGFMVGSATDTAELPKFSLALSPHKDWKVSLGPMADRIRSATSSVLFAVMEPNGQGPVLTSLRAIAASPIVFSYGTVETDNGLAVQNPDGQMGDVTGYAALTKEVPWPFTKEFDGGMGKHIHNKFVVVDFNAENPTVFTGSSNLAAGGEQANGDSLVMIEDGAIANMYAIEGVALFDHYHFRKKAKAATKTFPLTLWYPGKPGLPTPWWKSYYDTSKIQMRDRYLFADLPLPAGLQAIKQADWTALDAAAEAPKKKPAATAKKAAAKKKKSTTKKSKAKKKKVKKAKKKTAKTAKKKTAKKKKSVKKASKAKTKKSRKTNKTARKTRKKRA